MKRLAASPALIVYAVCAGALVGFAPLQVHWDLGWQLPLGEAVLDGHGLLTRLGAETFTAAGAPWTAQEWLFSTAFAAAHRAGLDAAFMGAVGVVAALALAVLAWTTAERRGGSVAVCLATFAATVAMLGGLSVRAQVIAWLPFALVMHALARRRPWWAVPAVIVWCNVHASGVLGPALVGLYAAGRTLETRRLDADARTGWYATGACALATLATPLGWRLPAYAWMLFTSPIRAGIDEWQSAFSFPMMQFWYVAVPLVGVTAVAVARRRAGLPERLILVALFALTMSAVRNIPLFVMAAAPLCAALFPAGVANAAPQRGRALVTRLASLVALGAAFQAAAGGAFGPRDRAPDPAAALARVLEVPGRHRLFCGNFGWCSGVLGSGRVQVFLDGRCDPYPPAIWDEYERIVHAGPGWNETLARRGVDLVLVDRRRPFARALRGSHAWRVAFDDGRLQLFRRS